MKAPIRLLETAIKMNDEEIERLRNGTNFVSEKIIKDLENQNQEHKDAIIKLKE